MFSQGVRGLSTGAHCPNVVKQLSTQVPVTRTPPPVSTPPLTKPEMLDSNLAKCRGFLLQCEFYLASLGDSDHSKIVNITGLLMGKALTWAMAKREKGGKATTKYERFMAMFRQVFDHAIKVKKIGESWH